MSVYEAIERRRSIRSYQEQVVPEEVLTRILEAARMAPSGENRQPWKFVVVTDKEADEFLHGEGPFYLRASPSF